MKKIDKRIAIKNYQKQYGLHHKKDKKYSKIYWPYLPVLLITVIGFSVGLFLLTGNQNNQPSTVSYASLFNSINQYRTSNGLSKLSYSQDLSTAAQFQANKISSSNSWSPLNESKYPTFSLISTRFQNLSSPTENLAYGFKNSGSIVSAWANSNYQNSNLLDANANSVGYGIINVKNFMNMKDQKIVVTIFADNKSIPTTDALPKTNPYQYGINDHAQSMAVIKLNSFIGHNSVQSLYILAGLMVLVAIVLLSKHTYLLHKWIKLEEKLVIEHPLFDIALVISFIVLAGAIQTTGYIS
ncbi:MAG TPA: CAP domain-containing protein [Candidatus Dormibacteraeota bacterium]|nr:CAP domain-containing protein [Candidatus Dormibacteraeota bacterium]